MICYPTVPVDAAMLRGRSVVATAPTDGQALVWDAASSTWVPGTVGAPTAGLGVYGDGSDGAVTVAADTTLTRDMYYTDLTVNNGVVLSSAGFRIFCAGTCTIAGTVRHNGVDAAGAGAGAGAADGSRFGGTGGGGGQVGAGSNGTNVAANRALGGAGGAGGSGGAAAGGTGGTASAPQATMGGYRHLPIALEGVGFGSVGGVITLRGGAGGGGGGGDGANSGGGGGGGGGTIVISTRFLVVSGAVQVHGGAGAAGTGGGASGGGGGGGGVIYYVYGTRSITGTVTATGGAGGVGAGAGGAGVAGSDGNVFPIQN